jgi:hypothetical protein
MIRSRLGQPISTFSPPSPKEADNKYVTSLQLPNLNHLFPTCKTGGVTESGAIEESVAVAALETMRIGS